MGAIIDLSGQQFGSWQVLSRAGSSPQGHALFLCRCVCGAERRVYSGGLIQGRSRCCGCLHQRPRSGRTTTPEYRAWVGMRHRCTAHSHDRENYFDRGIKVWGPWNTLDGFDDFLAHVGKRPAPEYSLDRIDNDKGYEPGNLRWADKKTQPRNRRKIARIELFTNEEFLTDARRRGFILVGGAN